MSTPLEIPEIIIFPSAIPSGEEGKPLYAWEMQLEEGAVLASENHGDEFGSVPEALGHAYSVFADLVDRRSAYPDNEEQVFRLTVRKS